MTTATLLSPEEINHLALQRLTAGASIPAAELDPSTFGTHTEANTRHADALDDLQDDPPPNIDGLSLLRVAARMGALSPLIFT